MIQPLDPLAFLRLAQELAHSDGDDARLRTAVGRAYYALFLAAREKVGIRGRGNVHPQVINALRQRKGYRSSADQLNKLRRMRNVADYELLPRKTSDRDWRRNWSRSQAIVQQVLPKLQALL